MQGMKMDQQGKSGSDQCNAQNSHQHFINYPGNKAAYLYK